MPRKYEYSFLKEQFFDPDPKYRLSIFFDAKKTDAAQDAANFVASCEGRDAGCIIPRISDDRYLEPYELEHFRNTYTAMLETARDRGLEIAFNLEGAIEDAIISSESEDFNENEIRSKVLVRREYFCSDKEDVKMPLRQGARMSLVAVNDYTNEIIDLREFVKGNTLEWTAPYGNWIIYEFLCVDDEERNYANVLNHKASYKYIKSAYSLFEDIFEDYIPDVLSVLSYSDLCFSSINRRDWDPSFNEVFENRFGFDPAPYYPALFSSNIKDAEHYKALFFECRAQMFLDGMLKALSEFANEKGLRLVGNVSEPKLSACSFVNGDALLDGLYAPGALLDKAYMYGTNSITVAAAASYNFGNDRVSCELFRDYYKISKRIMYNDTLNAYARGANLMLAHMPIVNDEEENESAFVKSETLPEWQTEFACFTSRTQALLRGGTHVSDIGLLYPIYTIHSKVNFYTLPASDGFEYPSTNENLDYMTIVSMITMFSGHDLTLIHPEAMNNFCSVDNGTLILNNGKRTEKLKVIILPCTEIVSIGNMRLLLEFYRSGGHLIATGELPSKAFELDGTDKEILEISREIFGDDAVNPDIMKSFCHNKNENGGEAYFLYFTRTAADGTKMVSTHNLNEALNSFDIPFDMYLPDMPRLQCTGALNNHYYEFKRLGLNYYIPGGGMLNHIHKRHGNINVYYFSNTTDVDYESFVLLKGALSPEEWNPHTVEIRPLEFRYVKWKGEIYTRIDLKIRHSTSIFIISDTTTNPPNIPDDIPYIDKINGLD